MIFHESSQFGTSCRVSTNCARTNLHLRPVHFLVVALTNMTSDSSLRFFLEPKAPQSPPLKPPLSPPFKPPSCEGSWAQYGSSIGRSPPACSGGVRRRPPTNAGRALERRAAADDRKKLLQRRLGLKPSTDQETMCPRCNC